MIRKIGEVQHKMKNIYYSIKRKFSNLLYHIRKLLNLPRPVDFKYVDIVFENCNTVRVPARLVKSLVIVDIRKDVFTNFCQQFIVLDYCKEFSITLENEALEIKTHFQKSFKHDSKSSFEHHLKVYKDITHVAVKPNKGKELYIHIPYDTEDERLNINLLQENKFEEDSFTISSKQTDSIKR